MGNDPVTDAIHHELRAAIAELARSVDIAAKRMAIRAKFTAAMADAKKTEQAAAALRAVALQGNEIVLKHAIAPQKSESVNGDIHGVEERNSACHWLMETATAAPSDKQKTPEGNESSFALRLLELHDRTGGFLKSESPV